MNKNQVGNKCKTQDEFIEYIKNIKNKKKFIKKQIIVLIHLVRFNESKY